MEGSAAEVLETAGNMVSSVDLTSIIELLQQMQEIQTKQLIFLSILCGMLLGAVVAMMFYDLWRHH